MRRIVAAIIPCALVLCAASAEAIVIRHDRTEQQAIDLGAQPQFASVGRLLVSGGTHSGVLVAPNWVLTAAHSVPVATPVGNISFSIGGNTYSAAERVLHPDWAGVSTAGNDLALLRLNLQVPGIAPATLFSGVELGRTATIVGYGQSSDPVTGILGPSGTRRGGTNVIDEYGSWAGFSSNLLLFDLDHPTLPGFNLTGSSTATDMEAGLTPGDSGGGLWLEVGSSWELAGIHAFGFGPIGSLEWAYGFGSASTAVRHHSQWINAVIPAPGTGAFALLAFALVARRRR